MKFKKAVSVILMLAVVLSSFAAMGGFAVNAAGTGTNLVSNGDFESGTTGWSTTVEDTLSTVEASDASDFNAKFKSGKIGKLSVGDSNSWIYQSVDLGKGTYTLTFNTYTASSAYYFGVYASDSGFTSTTVSDSNIIKYDTIQSINPNDVDTSEDATYKIIYGDWLQGAYRGPGKASRKNVYVFTLSETKKVHFAMRAGKNGILYVDNVSLEKVNTELENGDFETGDLTGFENASGSKIEIVNAKKNETDTTTFTGYAAYMPGGTADKANTLLQQVTLKPGTYTWSFDVDLITVNINGWNFLFGVYTGIADSGVGYGSNKSIGTATGKYKDGANCGAINKKDYNGFYLSYGDKDLTKNASLTVTFTLEATTVVYFDVRTSANARAYVDNMTLTRKKELDTKVYDFDNNGQFDDSFVVSDDNKNSTTMKIKTKASNDADHGNVLVLPKWAGASNSDRPASARFYKALEGLEKGKAYKISFDLKMDYSGAANEWLGLAGVRNSSSRDNGSDMLTVEDAFDVFGGIPQKFVAYTTNEAYTITQNPNNFRNAVIMWNGGTGWGTYVMEFVAESDTYFFWLENYLNKADMWVDNIQFSAIDSFSGEIDDGIIEDSNVKSVLVIGNSFAGDTIYEMQKVLDATSENALRVGKFGKGAQTAEYFAKIIENDVYGADFCYAEKGYTGERTVNKYTSFSEVKSFTKWDIILVQATTVDYSDTYRESVVKLVNALDNKGIDKSKIYLYVPWASRQDYLDRNNNIYASTATQITALNTYVEHLKADEELRGCTVISVYDELYRFSKYVDNIHRGTYGTNDGLHLNKLGQTALSMVLLNKLAAVNTTNLDFDTADYTDSEWADNDGGTITDVQLRAMKAIANGNEDAGVAQGDANYDDSVDIRDMIRIKKLTANSKYTAGGDCDSDGSLDAKDLASLRKYLLLGTWTDNDATANSISLVD